MNLLSLAEHRWLPEFAIRVGIRHLLQQRLQDELAEQPELQSHRYHYLIEQLKKSAIAIETDVANQQHYEVPAPFYEYALGEHLKYSACYWTKETSSLSEAEAAMLQLYCVRAELEDGQDILELGCGWGSLTLWMAAEYPASQITAVSNSHSQREFIEERARQRGLNNVRVLTSDVNDLSLDQTFDRVVSVEMFEHVRNYDQLMQRISGWLKSQGKLFVHIFCHRYLMYPFETEGDHNWMGRYFFTGGLMPAADTLLHFQKNLKLQRQWNLDGTHYQKTAEAWLQNLDHHYAEIIGLFEAVYGEKSASLWVQRWRIFFMACAELFGFRNGSEWIVSHYRFVKP